MEKSSRTITVDEKMKVLKLKVKVGTMLYNGRIVFIYESLYDGCNELRQKKLKSTEVGLVRKILIKEGDIILPGTKILELEQKCNHPTVIKDLCAECGADLQKENSTDGSHISQASVSMVHMVPELKVNEELAQILGKADMDRLLEHKKLVLLVDLDQTLIHTTNDDIPNNIKDVYHFQLYGAKSPWYHTRLRPGTHNFLQGVSEKYELHICTFGSRRYAHTIARFLDPDGKFFSHRILSRDECFDPNSKTANLRALFPCGENMVCIIDDREDVWDYASNLIHVKPYHFFQHTGDIHAPPSLAKHENDDDKEGFNFSQFTEQLRLNAENLSKLENTVSVAVVENVKNKKKDDIVTPLSEHCDLIKTEGSTKVKEENHLEGGECEGNVQAEIKDITLEKETDMNQSETVTEISSEKSLPTGSPADTLNLKETKLQELNSEEKRNVSEEKLTSSGGGTSETLHVIEEADDYLLYLEEILKIIHYEFFKCYGKATNIPDLKEVIPKTRANVLDQVRIVFSGIVPNRMKLEDSQAYKIARSLGAKVTQNIDSETTHLVALRAGTAKVHAACKRKNLKMVTPEWLWTCAERWEKVDERMYPLKNSKSGTEARHPPAHCKSPEHPEPLPMPFQITNNATASNRVGGSFLYTINPLMSLSSEDIESMEGEVEDIFRESDGEADDAASVEAGAGAGAGAGAAAAATLIKDESNLESEKRPVLNVKKRKLEEVSTCGSSSEDENQFMKKLSTKTKNSKKKKKRTYDEIKDDNLAEYLGVSSSSENDDTAAVLVENEDEDNDESDDETVNIKFRRGEDLPSDLDIEYNTEEGTEEEQESDGEWNVMGAALEREFLENE